MRKMFFFSRPHKYQRYNTVGDYIDGHGATFFSISEMGNEQYELLVAVHELVEKILCDKRGISTQSIDEFDMEFERRRQPYSDDEPGHDPSAPYHREHVFAERIERMLAEELGVDWDEYDKAVTQL